MKILFLPHCLRKDIAEKIKAEGERLDYEVYVVPGGSIIKKLIEEKLEQGNILKELSGLLVTEK